MNILNLPGFSSNCYLCGCRQQSTVKVANSKLNLPEEPIKSPLLCQYCCQRLPLSKSCCFTCGLPMFNGINANNGRTTQNQQPSCGECLKNSPPYDRVISAFHYEAPVSDFIAQLKYFSQFQLLPLLADYLTGRIRESYQQKELPKLIIAMPLHPVKLTKRGFNQSRLLADKMGHKLAISVLAHGVERIKNTQAQSKLNLIERKKNIKNAFKVRIQLPAHVAIIDDVVTTGMTAAELARQLLNNGAKKVDIWCIARAYDL